MVKRTGEGSKVTGKIGATTLPVGPSGEESHTCLGGLDLVINNNVDDAHKEAAADFISYMASADTQKEMTLISSQPPVVKPYMRMLTFWKQSHSTLILQILLQQEKSRATDTRNMQKFPMRPEKCSSGTHGRDGSQRCT